MTPQPVYISAGYLHALEWSHFGVLSPAAIRHRLGELVTCRHAAGRDADLAGVWGGDEFLFVLPPGCGAGFLGRLLRTAAAMTSALPDVERQLLRIKSAGLIDGFHVAAVLAPRVTGELLATAEHITTVAGMLKSAGRQTGQRETSGAVGTILAQFVTV